MKRYTLCESTSPFSDRFTHYNSLERAMKALNKSEYRAFILDNVNKTIIYKSIK